MLAATDVTGTRITHRTSLRQPKQLSDNKSSIDKLLGILFLFIHLLFCRFPVVFLCGPAQVPMCGAAGSRAITAQAYLLLGVNTALYCQQQKTAGEALRGSFI